MLGQKRRSHYPALTYKRRAIIKRPPLPIREGAKHKRCLYKIEVSRLPVNAISRESLKR